MQSRNAFQGASAAALCLQNDSLSHSDRSLLSASAHGSSGIGEVASQRSHLFGPMGGSGRQDISLAQDAEWEISSSHGGGRF